MKLTVIVIIVQNITKTKLILFLYILNTCMLLFELMITLCLKVENKYCVSSQSDDMQIFKFTSHRPIIKYYNATTRSFIFVLVYGDN